MLSEIVDSEKVEVSLDSLKSLKSLIPIRGIIRKRGELSDN